MFFSAAYLCILGTVYIILCSIFIIIGIFVFNTDIFFFLAQYRFVFWSDVYLHYTGMDTTCLYNQLLAGYL